jgi:hypothetical protein
MRRRLMVLVVAFLGLLTFVSPLIKTNPAVLGQTRWSPMQIATGLREGALPVYRLPGSGPVGVQVDAVLGFWAIYILLLAIVMADLLLPRSQFVVIAAGLGLGAALGSIRVGFSNLERTIYGPYSSPLGSTHPAFVAGNLVFYGDGVNAWAFVLILLGLFGLLIWIAKVEALDY